MPQNRHQFHKTATILLIDSTIVLVIQTMKTCLTCYSGHFYIIVKTFKIKCHNLDGLIDENILPLNFIKPPPQFHKTT